MRNTILLVAGQKGGGGKTTTAVNLAIWRKRQGRDVLLIDGDHQQSATTWARRRAELPDIDVRVPCVAVYGRTLANEVRNLASKYDDIVIDVAGHKSEEFLSAMGVAHRMLTPVRASQFDLDTMLEVDNLVAMMRAINPDLDARWFINQATTHAMAKESAIAATHELLADLPNLRPLTAYLCHRAAFEATGSGIVIDEAAASVSQKKGAIEFHKLAQEAWL